MREALAWRIFNQAKIPSSRQVYARFCINERYYGLYSIIEEVDKAFLKDRFDKNSKGNLYKAYSVPGDIGSATLAYRGKEGRRYYKEGNAFDDRTYRLKTNDGPEDPSAAQTYDDLAKLVTAINGVDLPSGADKFNTPQYRTTVEAIFDVRGFLTWAAANLLLGAWDNYWGTPANYYLYNGGAKEDPKRFMEKPYFTWIPWDYDNTLGIDYFDVDWWRADLVDWEAATVGYYDNGTHSNLPLITHLLKNDDFPRFYLDQVERLLNTTSNPSWIVQQIGTEGSGGLWDRVRSSAYLEADTGQGSPHTGRQFTNDQVYWNGFQSYELIRGTSRILGIRHAMTMRQDTAREQLTSWRRRMRMR
jgi:hypothetical protein